MGAATTAMIEVIDVDVTLALGQRSETGGALLGQRVLKTDREAFATAMPDRSIASGMVVLDACPMSDFVGTWHDHSLSGREREDDNHVIFF